MVRSVFITSASSEANFYGVLFLSILINTNLFFEFRSIFRLHLLIYDCLPVRKMVLS